MIKSDGVLAITKDKMRYFIEYRPAGSLRKHLDSVYKHLKNKFPDTYIKDERYVPHLTIIPPINTDARPQIVLNTLTKVLSQYKLLKISSDGYDFFDNEEKVIYLKIRPTTALVEMQEQLLLELSKKFTIKNKWAHEGFNPHIAIAFCPKETSHQKILSYLNETFYLKEKYIFDQIDILNGNRVICAYSLLDGKLLSSKEATNNSKRLIRLVKNLKNLPRNPPPIQMGLGIENISWS